MTMKTLLIFILHSTCIITVKYAAAQSASISVSQWTETDRRQLKQLLQSSLDTLVTLIEPLSEEQFFHKKNDSSWSVAQIIEHLSQIEDGYIREYFVAINTPPASQLVTIKTVTDSAMMAYETTPENTKARGTNLPLNRYCTKKDAIRILQESRAETLRVIDTETKDLRTLFTYRKKGADEYEAKDLHQHFLLLVAHMKRHTLQAKKAIYVKRSF